MKQRVRILVLVSLVLLVFCCGNTGQNSSFNGKPTTIFKAQARISRDHDKPPTPVQKDTLLPGDSIMLQGAVTPDQNAIINSHWWRIDGSLLPDTAGYFLHWVFANPGKHLIIFGVIDNLGDSLEDTAVAVVSTPPQMGSLFIPRDSAWGINLGLTGGMPFEWETVEADSATALQQRFRLYKGDSLLLDTLLHEARVTYWGTFSPLTLYHWKVYAVNQFGLATDTLKAQFSTGALDGSSALVVQVDLGVQALLHRMGGQIDTQVSTGNTPLRFAPIVAGEYTLILQDTLHPGYEPETLRTMMNEAQLKNLGKITLSDITPPILQCADCYLDSLTESQPMQFSLLEKGSGIASSKCYALVDGNNVPLTITADSLVIPIIPWTLTPEYHQVQIYLADNSGNDSLFVYWLPVRHSTLTPTGGYP